MKFWEQVHQTLSLVLKTSKSMALHFLNRLRNVEKMQMVTYKSVRLLILNFNN